MFPLSFGSTYASSGSMFSRSLLLQQTLPKDKKVFFLFETIADALEAKEILSISLATPISLIKTESDLVSSIFEKGGYFAASIGIFDEHIRLQYKKDSLSFSYIRWHHYERTEIIDTLVAFGYIHSKYLTENKSYTFDGDTLAIRHGENTALLSFFGEELDDIRKKTDHSLLESIQIFKTESDAIGELKKFDPALAALMPESILVFFDLEFSEKRPLISQHFSTWLAFESTKESISCEIDHFSIETLEEFEIFLREYGDHTTIYTRLTEVLESFLEINTLSVQSLHKTTKKWSYESFQWRKNGEVFFVICDDILGRLFVKERIGRKKKTSIDLLLSFVPGDYLVHFEHGIWKFIEVTKKDIGGLVREYITLEYAKGDRLYVPITEVSRLTKYLWSDEVELHHLSGNAWKTTLEKTEDEVEKRAKELLEIYATRHITRGYAFPAFKEKEQCFRQAFPYEHTKDQILSIEEVFSDMEKNEPMNRLLSGDVGFWKTEVAMNAAYKAVLWGKQVAVISPLVVLAIEHDESFRKRFQSFPVWIELLTRFTSDAQARKILQQLRDGSIDIIIGTHRLLSEDVHFERLWLLIIDEEHRFWVMDKERITKLQSRVDLLSLSATPIPRSLNMALSGMKQLSMLSQPPPSKKPIHTIAIKWQEKTIQEAIEQELSRGGQVIFLHNRIASLLGVKEYLESILPKKLRIAMIHGQMESDLLERHLIDFKNEKYHLLLSTTVIENGVNFLKANTIIIDNADEFGLAQLHQLRGRVGRKDEQAHCFLVYRKEHLSIEAKKRLIALIEHSRLGSGFEIALRDLEIRWAGEILWIKQSGRVKEVGISLYLKLLEKKVEELQNGEKNDPLSVTIDLDISYTLEDELFSSEEDRMYFYRSIESIDTLEDLESSKESFALYTKRDHSGIHHLFLLLKARILLAHRKIVGIKRVQWDYVMDFNNTATVEDIRRFLAVDSAGNFIVQSIKRIRVSQKCFQWDLDFLEKIVYSLELISHE